MKRREFITLLGGTATMGPLAARAQEVGRTYRLGSLHLSPRNARWHVALFDELKRHGFIEGQNLLADAHGWGLRVEQLDQHASEIVKAQVDVIYCTGDAAIRAAQQATKTIPILGLTDNMVGSGLVRSLAKPAGNITCVSILAGELDGKRQEILMEAVPGARRMAVLADPNTTSPQQFQALEEETHTRGVELLIYRVMKPEEIAGAIDTAKSSGASALNVLATPLLFNNRQIILPRAATLRLPTILQAPEGAEDGSLIAYGPRFVQLYREIMARQLVMLLRGAKPADLPVEQPTKFELVINLKTATAIGVDVPSSLLLRADEVIE
jgi:putative ABC transport system substrate-binding protein